jgi:hypothetical protein
MKEGKSLLPQSDSMGVLQDQLGGARLVTYDDLLAYARTRSLVV